MIANIGNFQTFILLLKSVSAYIQNFACNMSLLQIPWEFFSIPKKWIYRGEGNCNLAISLPNTKQILRIRKTEKPKSFLGWILVLLTDLFYWYGGKESKEEVRDLNFYSKIMRPLLGQKYTSESKLVILSRKQVQIFRNDLIRERPSFRQSKTLQYGRAALFTDFAFLPKHFDHPEMVGNTFAVEIKPKQGWRPIKEHIHPQCFFCMNQYLKLEKKRIKYRTNFCPEELFSGDEDRMVMALENLIDTPQNNLKIFKNGSLCFEDQNRNMDVFKEIFEISDNKKVIKECCKFLQKCLIKSFEKVDNFYCLGCEEKTSHTNLPKGSALERILSVQMLDDEGTHSTYKKLTKCDIWEDFSFVEKTLNVVDTFKEDFCMRCAILEASKSVGNELMFLPYLISAIAKDCSLMITFRRIMQKPCDDYLRKHLVETEHGMFLVNIGIFDLYPKPFSTVQKHYKRNRDIFRAVKKCGVLN